ncbi:MAG: NAD(P)-dependent oxidoreductase [Butyrivibrio sp.]|nr:NAD(P)-dependent oxidoreductase [Butyrivibrio sp.]
MKTAVVTGAFGFAGANLTEALLNSGYKVYAIGRKGSLHNSRFTESDKLRVLLLAMDEYDQIAGLMDSSDVTGKDVIIFHLAWGGGRDDFDAQYSNIEGSLKAMDSAISLKEKAQSVRFVGIGSQAEYGVKSDKAEITENMSLEPFSAYGAAKAAAYYLLKKKAEISEIQFIWGRIFSLIGKYEPEGRMLPDLVKKLKDGQEVNLSSCEQYWDYLDAVDAAGAIMALGERGVSGEAYNIANGKYDLLRNFVLEAADHLGADRALLHFGKRADPFVSLRPSVQKIKRDTGWEASTPLIDSIKQY